MTFYALVDDNGDVAEVRNLDPAGVATHKLAADGGARLRPLVQVEKPAFNPLLEQCAFSYTVTQSDVTETWDVTRLPVAVQAAAVKIEARNRILSVFPEWKQANMTARAVELVDKLRTQALDAGEQTEYDAMQGAWVWIKAVRAASNALEAMSPIPLDFQDDSHWPLSP